MENQYNKPKKLQSTWNSAKDLIGRAELIENQLNKIEEELIRIWTAINSSNE